MPFVCNKTPSISHGYFQHMIILIITIAQARFNFLKTCRTYELFANPKSARTAFFVKLSCFNKTLHSEVFSKRSIADSELSATSRIQIELCTYLSIPPFLLPVTYGSLNSQRWLSVVFAPFAACSPICIPANLSNSSNLSGSIERQKGLHTHAVLNLIFLA